MTAEALLQKLPIPQKVLGSGVVVTLGQQLEQQELLERLIELGYERTTQVDAIGQFCLRGDILDISRSIVSILPGSNGLMILLMRCAVLTWIISAVLNL